MISAWAVGSLAEETRFIPQAMTVPSRAMTAPNGPPRPSRIFSADSAMAHRINSNCEAVGGRIDIRTFRSESETSKTHAGTNTLIDTVALQPISARSVLITATFRPQHGSFLG